VLVSVTANLPGGCSMNCWGMPDTLQQFTFGCNPLFCFADKQQFK
jgi:hypothetical protein